MLTPEKLLFLQNKALNLRIDSARATTQAESGHVTSACSAADIVAAIFFHFLRYELKNPKNPTNDRFILSKGHAIPVIYAAWKQLGVISDEQLMTLRKFDSVLEGHPTPRFAYNEAATGSLGQGLGIAAGMALNARKSNLDYITYCMVGDAESAEGSIWEAAEFCGHYGIDKLIGILDCNRLGQSGETLDDHHMQVYVNKWSAFGWKTFLINGHDINEIVSTIQAAQKITNQPVMIIAKTIKGYGFDDIADKNGYHGKPFSHQDLDKRIKQLQDKFAQAYAYKSSLAYTPPSPSPVQKPSQTTQTTSINLTTDPQVKEFTKDQKIATRKAFGYALAAVGRVNNDVFALDGDVKNSTYTEIFEKEFPDRFVQCYVAEQNMLSVATGLQSRGKIPFAATFACFFTRAFDQIRMAGIGKNALRLCGSHAGVSIGEDGPSQMGLEDIAMFQTVPHSVVLYPSDGVSTYKLVEYMTNYHEGISYLRTTRAATPNIYSIEEPFQIGGCKILKQSHNDVACIVAAGITLHESLKAYDVLAKEGISVAVIDLYSIKPFDRQTVIRVAEQSNNRILTVEDHYFTGGIGQTIASALTNDHIHVDSLYVPDIARSGTPEKNLSWAGIDAEHIVKKIKSLIS